MPGSTFNKGERVHILDEKGSPTGQTGTLTGERGHVDLRTESWEVKLDQDGRLVSFPSRFFGKISSKSD